MVLHWVLEAQVSTYKKLALWEKSTSIGMTFSISWSESNLVTLDFKPEPIIWNNANESKTFCASFIDSTTLHSVAVTSAEGYAIKN